MKATKGVGALRRALLAGATIVGALAGAGCSLDSLLKSDELPPDVTDPAITKTREGAIAAYVGLRGRLRDAYGTERSFLTAVGLLTDELQVGGQDLGASSIPVDVRVLLEGVDDDHTIDAYSKLQRTRGQASQAIQLLRLYAPDLPALAGHAYAIQAYSEIFLAELFCSGIPLSTLDFDGDFTLAPGSSMEQVYEHALALVDTALVLAADSARFVHLARMAQARALLGLGRLDEAAAAVADVPDDWRYEVTYDGASSNNFMSSFARNPTTSTWFASVSDVEGVNGLPYRSSGDPRTRASFTRTNNGGQSIYHPDRYPSDGGGAIVLASGVEARLIEAEADLAAGGTAWLDILNTLRTNGEVASTYTREDRRGISSGTGAPQTGSPGPAGVVDTTWGPGTGTWLIAASILADAGPVCPSGPSPGLVCTDTSWYKGLRVLEDPGTPEARLDLLFRERAFWLFLTGHRQGDLRRLIRQYGREDFELYPSGAYPAPGESYGSDVTAPIPAAERVSNPHFTGCISRNA